MGLGSQIAKKTTVIVVYIDYNGELFGLYIPRNATIRQLKNEIAVINLLAVSSIRNTQRLILINRS